MRQLKITAILDLSLERTKAILLQPFQLKKWLKLSLIAFLSGSLYWGFNWPTTHPSTHPFLTKFFPSVTIPSQYVIFLFSALTVLSIIFFIWLAAHFSFLFLQNIMDNSTSIRKLLIKNKNLANSLFMFNFRIVFYTILSWIVIGFIVFKNFTVISLTFKSFPIWTIIFGVSFFLIEIILLGIISFLTNNFIIPIMILDQCKIGEGWKKFIPIIKQNWKDCCVLLFVSLLINFILSIAAGIILLSVILAFLIIGVLILLPLYLVFILLLKWNFMILFIGGILGLLFLAFLFFLMLLYLPLAIFTKNFALYFLSSLNCGYTPLPITSTSGEPS